MKLAEIEYTNILFDYYKELLTEKQRDYFEMYYFEDLSLGEIAENLDVSRNAVHKQIKKVVAQLNVFEEKLELYKKDDLREMLLSKINELSDSKYNDIIDEIKGI